VLLRERPSRRSPCREAQGLERQISGALDRAHGKGPVPLDWRPAPGRDHRASPASYAPSHRGTRCARNGAHPSPDRRTSVSLWDRNRAVRPQPYARSARGAQPIIVKHMSAVLEPTAAAPLRRAIWTYEGQPLTRAALKLSALTFQRPGNIRHMKWREIDFSSAQWTIPASKMKRSVQGKESGRPHLVPLAPQDVDVLRELGRPLPRSCASSQKYRSMIGRAPAR
jgi:integrase